MTVTVALLLVMITGICAADTDNPPDLPEYTDTCIYSNKSYSYKEQSKCGVTCIVNNGGSCSCGNDTFSPQNSKEQCCIPSHETCNLTLWMPDGTPMQAVCIQGVKIPMSSQCDNSARSLQCYNSYQDSQEISLESYFTCPDTCVSVINEMCRGVNWCSTDVQECGPQLRCYESIRSDWQRKPLLSNLNELHHYCLDKKNDNNQVFDSLDRSDELNIVLSEGTSYDIDDTEFQTCQEGEVNVGLTCGSECLSKKIWCTGQDSYTFSCGPKNISWSDKRLCGNPLVFSKVSCLYYDYNVVSRDYDTFYGRRCSGTNKKCYYPWYTQVNGGKESYFPPKTCDDKSDEIFQTNLTCWEQLQQNIEFHNTHFCNSSNLVSHQ